MNGEHVDLNAHEIGIKCSVWLYADVHLLALTFQCVERSEWNLHLWKIWLESCLQQNTTQHSKGDFEFHWTRNSIIEVEQHEKKTEKNC